VSTRGLFGFKTEKDYYMCFSPTDSYPSGMGEYWYKLVKNEYDLNHMKQILDNVASINIKEEQKPSDLEDRMIEALGLSGKDECKKILDLYNEISSESDVGVFDALSEGRIDFFLNDKAFMKDALFCEWVYYYDYTTKKFIAINNREGEEHPINLDDSDWQKIFKMLELD